jgi:competence protein ComEA
VPETSRSTVVVWAIAAVLAVVAGARLLGGDHGAPPAPVRLAPEGKRQNARIYIHVAGAVRRPGLMTMSAGSRVADALERAGGPERRADLTAINLAAQLADGQQIVVPRAGAAQAGAASSGAVADGGAATGGSSSGPSGAASISGGAVTGIHLSTATVEQLDGVDGIGPTLAQRIIEYRDTHGGFRSLAELAQVDGIGEKRLATLRNALQL